MTAAQLIAATAEILRPIAEESGGAFHLAATQSEAAKLIGTAPKRWRLILLWDGYQSHQAARLGMSTHSVACVIQAASGLPAKPDAKIVTMAGLIESVSLWMRAIKPLDGTGLDSAGFALDNSRWLESAQGTDAHVLGFTISAALPAYSENIPLTVPD